MTPQPDSDDPHSAETVTGEAYRNDPARAEPRRPPDDHPPCGRDLWICTGILLIMASGLLAMCNALSQL